MSPCALVAVHFAKDVVEQNIGAAGRIRAGIVADDRVETERRLDRFAFEPAVEEAACRFSEQFQHVTLLGQVELHQPASLNGGVNKCLQPVTHIGRRFQRKVAQDVGNAFQHIIIFGKHRGVMF